MNRGAAPPAITGEQQQRAHWVRAMFGQVASRYDLLNHLLSFHLDRYWRWQAVRSLRPVLEKPAVRVLDACCGSGDLSFALAAACRGRVLGSDFSHPMLLEAKRKRGKKGPGTAVALLEADTLRLPLPDRSVDLVTSAFGFRNLANYRAGLAEIRRVLKPGGTLALLEFSQPPNRWFRRLYNFYSRRILPAVGGLVSGSREAYAYLPDSVKRFPPAPALAAWMEAAGFRRVAYRYLSGGIVALHTGTTAPAPGTAPQVTRE